MLKKPSLSAPIVLAGLGMLVAFNGASGLSGQSIKPRASPASSVGNANAPASIEVFNDYQCPPCGRFNEQLKQIQSKYKGRVQIVFRNFPLTRIHRNALAAARAAEAAGLQGKFVEMIDRLYQNLGEWSGSEDPSLLFTSYACKIGLDPNRFSEDFNGELVRQRIQLDVERAESLQVFGTPTVLLNGTELRGELADIDQLIEQSLKTNERKPTNN